MFSSRLPPRLEPNPVSRAAALARASGQPVFDLTETNPTTVGLMFPTTISTALADPESLVYAPDPLGTRAARRAVARACRPGVAIDPERIVLTASTSEAYSLLFKLACDPGDEVLVPVPSYPLFEWLTALDAVRAVPYRLAPEDNWRVDRESVVAGLSALTRALLVVSPNNPTGSMLRADDRDWIAGLARDRGLMLIADEVFYDYPLAPSSDATSLIGETRALTWTLGGLSKSAGLPQMKLAWMIASGPDALVAEAMKRVAVIADTYLSVATPVQVAAAALLESGSRVRALIQERIRTNLGYLRSVVATRPAMSLVEPEGGWSAVVRVPAVEPEERIVLRSIEEARVIVHPGYFFEFPHEAFLALSLLPRPEIFREGVRRLATVTMGARA